LASYFFDAVTFERIHPKKGESNETPACSGN
jgi:hypothetical protein